MRRGKNVTFINHVDTNQSPECGNGSHTCRSAAGFRTLLDYVNGAMVVAQADLKQAVGFL